MNDRSDYTLSDGRWCHHEEGDSNRQQGHSADHCHIYPPLLDLFEVIPRVGRIWSVILTQRYRGYPTKKPTWFVLGLSILGYVCVGLLIQFHFFFQVISFIDNYIQVPICSTCCSSLVHGCQRVKPHDSHIISCHLSFEVEGRLNLSNPQSIPSFP